MKTFLLGISLAIIGLILCVSLALSQDQVARMSVGVVGGGAAAAGVAYCSSCTGTTDADVICDGFENTDCIWTDTDGGSACTIDHSNTATAGIGCTDAETKSLLFTKTAAASQNCYSTVDAGAAKASLFIQFYINPIAVPPSDTNAVEIVWVSTVAGGTDRCFQLKLKNNATANNFVVDYWNGSGYNTWTGSTAYTTSTWYPVRLEWVSGTSMKIYVDWNNDGVYTTELEDTTTIGTRSCQYISFASNMSAVSYAVTVEYDNIKIDDDTRPTACTR